MMSIHAIPMSKSAYIIFLAEEPKFPFYFCSAVCILVPIIGKMGVSYSSEMGRSSELRDRFRSSAIWRTCYAEHERHPLCQSLILQLPSLCSLLPSSSHNSYSNWVGCTGYTSLTLRKATQSDES